MPKLLKFFSFVSVTVFLLLFLFFFYFYKRWHFFSFFFLLGRFQLTYLCDYRFFILLKMPKLLQFSFFLKCPNYFNKAFILCYKLLLLFSELFQKLMHFFLSIFSSNSSWVTFAKSHRFIKDEVFFFFFYLVIVYFIESIF